jgi:CheY-like chemotaxis protein
MLLVEDSKFLRMATEHSLSKAGYLVSTAADGEEALQVAKEKLPDMMLPKISGPNVLKALKENPATIHIPVIVLTSLSYKNEEKLISEVRPPTSRSPLWHSTRTPISWRPP